MATDESPRPAPLAAPSSEGASPVPAAPSGGTSTFLTNLRAAHAKAVLASQGNGAPAALDSVAPLAASLAAQVDRAAESPAAAEAPGLSAPAPAPAVAEAPTPAAPPPLTPPPASSITLSSKATVVLTSAGPPQSQLSAATMP